MKAPLQSKFSDDEDATSETDWTSSQACQPSRNTPVDKDMDEDDIPLAQRIPGALQAQKSIRIRDKAYKSAKVARLGPETKQSAPSEFTGILARKLTLLKKDDSSIPPSNGPPQISHSVMHVNHMHLPDTLLPPASSISPNAPWVPRNRSRNISFSQQPTANVDSIHYNNAAPVLSRSSTQSASKPSPKIIQSSTDSSAMPSFPPSRAQTLAVRNRSKSFSSISKPSNYPPEANDRVAPLPITPRPMQAVTSSDGSIMRQRVFIDSMQRFNDVLIQAHTCAYDIITTIASQGELGGNVNDDTLKHWMLWEIVQDFGLERPIRHYERLSEIYASWNSNTKLSAFMLQKTPLSSILAPDKIPNSSPTFNGYVRWEAKRGKWNKRWMELREHSIWLSKRNTGKDRTFLCSLSSFDCYFTSRPYKAPKSFVFALKSTDNLTMFENPADYLHIFSCDANEGVRWTQAVLLARSYVLHKERTVLFTSPTSSTIPVTTYSHPDHHEHKKISNVNKPLLEFKAQPNGSNDKRNFQSGSLLARS